MKSHQKPGKQNRIPTLLKTRKKITQNTEQISSPESHEESPPPFTDDYNRTRARYVEAAKLLQQAVKSGEKWGEFDFPELNGEFEEFNDKAFGLQVDKTMEVIKDKDGQYKCRNIVGRLFEICSPLAKHFLTIAINVQSVSFDPHSFLTF